MSPSATTKEEMATLTLVADVGGKRRSTTETVPAVAAKAILAAAEKQAWFVSGSIKAALTEADLERLALLEKSKDDHFYGPWKGGSRSAGGHPADEDTQQLYQHGGEWADARLAIHDRYYDSVVDGVPTSDSPTVYMTGGGPASGKTVGLLQNPGTSIPDKTKAAHIDPDGAKEHIPEYKAGIKAGDKSAAGYVHEESSYMSKVAVNRALGSGHDVVYDSVGDSGIDKLGAKVQQMRDAGAKNIVAHYATLDVEEAIRRSDARAVATGRFVPHAYIRSAHADVARTVQAAVERGTFNRLGVWDTSGKTPKLIANYEKGKGLTIIDGPAYKQFTARGNG